MTFNSPGFADSLTDDLRRAWNASIEASYRALEPDFGSRFFALDPATIAPQTRTAIKWFGNPAEPRFCFNDTVARQLSDWGMKGRHRCHNEYCEYFVVHRKDRHGNERPKRVVATTELREYWTCMAMYDPAFLRDRIAEILGAAPPWEEIYGAGVSDPLALDPKERRVRFARQVAGNGNERDLQAAGVPVQPTGRLNTENILFMTHPINGLDDLLYIVMFGAHPYAKRQGGQHVGASKEAIFRWAGVTQLACRNADPAAAMGAHAQAIDGRKVGFADPLGMYILSFSSDVFLFEGAAVPEEWIRLSRGRGDPAQPLVEGHFQRLEFGPGDDDDVFLDQLTVAIGSEDRPLSGGYDVASHIEVGPKVVIGERTALAPADYVVIDGSDDPIDCRQAEICSSLAAFKQEYDDAHGAVPAGLMVRPRGRIRRR